MPDQEFLASFGVQIDESGLNRLQQALEKNRALAEDLAAAFDRARQAVQSFFSDLSELSLPNLDLAASARVTEEARQGIRIPFSLDFAKAQRELQAFFREAGKSMKLSADASGVISAGQGALSSLYSLYASAVLPLRARVQTIGTTTGGGGGRTGGGAGVTLTGLTELLSSAKAAAAPVMNQSTTNSVQAPVSINVTAAGTDPEAVGRSVYDVTEQYLLRTLKDVTG